MLQSAQLGPGDLPGRRGNEERTHRHTDRKAGIHTYTTQQPRTLVHLLSTVQEEGRVSLCGGAVSITRRKLGFAHMAKIYAGTRGKLPTL